MVGDADPVIADAKRPISPGGGETDQDLAASAVWKGVLQGGAKAGLSTSIVQALAQQF